MTRALGAVVHALGMVAAAQDAQTAIAAALDCLSGGLLAEVTLEQGTAAGEGGGQTRIAASDAELVLRVDRAPLPGAIHQALVGFVDTLAAVLRRQGDLAAHLAKTEGKLARRDTLLRAMFDLSPVGILLIEEETAVIIEANAAFLGFGNWAREEVVGQDIFELMPESDRHVPAAAVAQLAHDSHFGPIEHVFQRPDGGIFPAVVRGVMLNSGMGKGIIWVLVEDVSQAQAHLSEVQSARDEAIRARAELQTAVQALPHGFMLFDRADRVVMVNDQMREIYPELAPHFHLGLTYGEMLQIGVGMGLFPEAFGRVEAFTAEIAQARSAPSNDRLIPLHNGRLIRALDRDTPDGGKVGLRIDVTAEHEAARRLGDVIAGSQAGTWEVDLITGENIVNDRWAEMLGLTRADFGQITSRSWESLIHPDDRARVIDCVNRMIAGETLQYEQTYRMAGVDGEWIWINDRGRISARAADGTALRMAGVHLDISALKEAEQRLELIIQSAEAGTWQFDVKTGTNRINSRWAEMLGYPPNQWVHVPAKIWHGLIHPDDLRTIRAYEKEIFSRGEWFYSYELRLRHKAGHWVWVQSRGQVTRWDDNGVPSQMSGVHLDISARKKLEDDLKAERDFLAMLTETSVSGIMAVDGDAHILFLNREAVAILEAPAEMLVGQVCDPVALSIRDNAGGAMTLADMPCRLAIATNRIQRDFRLRLTMPDGRVKVVSVNAAPLPDTGLNARIVCTITDITDAAHAEAQLRAAIDRAEAASRAKSQFLANMSHELRTPLNGVLGMAELLSDANGPAQSPDQTRAMAQTIRESGTLLLSILNDILDLAKIESGKLSLSDEVFSLRDLTQRIDGLHGLGARSKGLDLTLALHPDMGLTRRGDAQRLLQVLHNLVGNAVKFTETGAVSVDISADGPQVQITVSDSGIGMTPEQIAIVFEEFTQADGSITRRFGGTGLGLPIVKRLVTLMGGEVTLTSAPGQGTKVQLRLYLPESIGGSGPVAAADRPDFTGLRALVAEDNATNRMILRAMLGRLGIDVTLAADGDQAVALFADGAFDLLLLDISMPQKDGITALGEMRAAAGAGGLPPALAVTANAMTHLVDSYRAAGFADVVTKPIQLDALAASILRVCPVAAAAVSAKPPGG